MLNATTEMLYKQWEKMFSGFMDYLVRNETFLASMGKMMEGSSIFKMVVDKSFERALESMRMPTRKDLEETLYAVRKLESSVLDTQERIDALSDKLDKMAGLLAAQARMELDRVAKAEKAAAAVEKAPVVEKAPAEPKVKGEPKAKVEPKAKAEPKAEKPKAPAKPKA